MQSIDFIKIFWFFLPAGTANMSPVIFKFVNFLNFPVDFNKKIGGKPIFGRNKTYRGFFFGIVASIFIVFLQASIYPGFRTVSLVDYSSVSFWILGFLLGFGALFGDLVKSFFKRQLNIPSGKTWAPFDQIDWIIGAVVFACFYINLSVDQIVVAIVMFGLLHPIVNLTAYFLKIKNNKF